MGAVNRISIRKAKWLTAGLLLMLFFFFGIALLLPSKVTVSKSVVIAASLENVGAQVKNFNNWKKWYPAFQDKEISIHIANDSLIPTAILRDKNNREIKFSMIQNEAGNVNVRVFTDKKITMNYQFVISTDKKGTLIIWNANIDLGWYPWIRIQGIVMDKLTGPEYDLALQNLKKVSEAAPPQTDLK